MKVVCCLPTIRRPHQATLDALERAYPAVTGAGWEFCMVAEIGNAYISAARSLMTAKALAASADVVFYLDHDVSFMPGDLLRLLEMPDDVVAGTYRYKSDDEDYMGAPLSKGGRLVTRVDGSIAMQFAPAGFLKVTRAGIEAVKAAHPELVYGIAAGTPHVDLFNHGAVDDVWYGEDYAFCRRWRAMGRTVWLIPDLDLTHHADDKAYPGNYHRWLTKRTREIEKKAA